jgi:hypothetical protein
MFWRYPLSGDKIRQHCFRLVQPLKRIVDGLPQQQPTIRMFYSAG